MTDTDDPTLPVARDLTEIIRSKVHQTDDCWLWTGALSTEGYGVYGRGAHLVHRLSYEYYLGPISPGAMVDHKCRNRACVNPQHLHTVTNRLNQQNRSGPPSNNTSGFRGVHWAPDHKKWRISVRHQGRRHYGGYFNDLAEAAQAVVVLRSRFHTNNLADREGAR